MNKKVFLLALGKALAGLNYEEQDKWLDFYSEMIDDRMEDGLTEIDAVAAVGTVEEIANQILYQSGSEKKTKKTQKLKTWQLVLLILGSPLWFSLLIAVASVVFSLIVAVWSVVIGLYAAAVAIAVSGLALVLAPLFMIPLYSIGAGGFGLDGSIVCVGAGLFCMGFGILWFIGTNLVARGTVWLCKKLFSLCLPRRRSAQ